MDLRQLIEEDSRVKKNEKDIAYTKDLVFERYEELKQEEKRLRGHLQMSNICESDVSKFFNSLNFTGNNYVNGISMANTMKTFKFKDTVFEVIFNEEFSGIDININIEHVRTGNRYKIIFQLDNESKLKVTRKINLTLNDEEITDYNLKTMVSECNDIEKLRNLEFEINENMRHIKMGMEGDSLVYVYKIPNLESNFETFGKAFDQIEF